MYVFAKNNTPVKFPYSFAKLCSDNLGTSFPEKINDRELAAWNVYPVQPQELPECDPATEQIIETSPILRNGKWIQNWLVQPLTQQQIEEQNATKQAEIRTERNFKLAATDWTQLPDVPADVTAWTAYRQALRDVTAQETFPWSVQWPTTPKA
jgi:hypothetical protein